MQPLVRPGAVPPLTISQFTAEPLIIRVNQTTLLNVSASGGRPPLSYAYTGLPTNCTSRDAASLTCTPWQVGTFTVKVWVNDSDGSNVTGTTRLLVREAAGPPLVIIDYSVKPSTVSVGGVIWVRVNTTGGTLPVSYGFYGLPPGCYNFDEQNLSCVPQATGGFPIVIAVTDSDNRVVDAVAFLNVTGSTPASTGSGVGVGETAALVVVALAAAASVVVTWRFRRRRKPGVGADMGGAARSRPGGRKG